MRRTKEAAEETRRAILEAAERVFFECGVACTTLEGVAKAAGVTRGAVYWHFRNKMDLFNAVQERVRMPMEEVFYRIVESEAADALESLEAFATTSFARLHEDARIRRIYAILLLKCERSGEMASLVERERVAKERVTHSLTGFFRRLQKAGVVPPDREPRTLAVALYAYMLGLFTDYLRAPELYRMPHDATKLVHQFFAPLMKK